MSRLQMCRRILATLTATMVVAAGNIAGCQSSDDAPGPPVYRAVEGAATPLWVPEGSAWIGYFKMDTAARQVSSMNCVANEIEPFPTANYHVSGFYLDPDETTIAVYDKCVAAGECDPRTPTGFPETPNLPVSVDGARAMQLCKWRGGYLPSYLQLKRAEVGDVDIESPGSRGLMWRLLDCNKSSSQTTECQEVVRRGPHGDHPDQEIRAYKDDVGPYGHYDLFGSQKEITSSSFNADEGADDWKTRDDVLCAKKGGIAPNLTGGDTLAAYGPAHSFTSLYPGDTNLIRSVIPYFPSEGATDAFLGMRCAYLAEPTSN